MPVPRPAASQWALVAIAVAGEGKDAKTTMGVALSLAVLMAIFSIYTLVQDWRHGTRAKYGALLPPVSRT